MQWGKSNARDRQLIPSSYTCFSLCKLIKFFLTSKQEHPLDIAVDASVHEDGKKEVDVARFPNSVIVVSRKLEVVVVTVTVTVVLCLFYSQPSSYSV